MGMKSGHDRLVDPEELLLRTDWSSVEHCCPNVAPTTPAILRQLLDDDAGKQGAALRDLQQAVTHSNTFYSATAPAASFVAAILGHPRTLAPVTDQTPWEAAAFGAKPRFPLRVGLLNWLCSAAWDANEESPDGYEADIEAFRTLRPTLYEAIQPFLADDEQQIRDAAMAAVLPLIAAPELVHQAEDITSFQRYRHTPDDVRAHTEGFADDPPF